MFSLTTLLHVRRQQEELAHKNLLEAHLVLRKITVILQELHKELENLREQIRQSHKKRQNYSDLASYYRYMDVVKKKIERQGILVKEAEASVERQREDVVKAMQKRKIIENLRDKKLAEWESDNFDLERASLDELATMRYAKGKLQSK